MPWGSGTFTRVYNWYQQYLDGFGIDPQKMDSEDDNFAGGINNCLTKDGQNAPDQDLPMGGFKHTNIGNAVNRNEYLPVGQYQDGWGVYAGVSTGDADNYIVSLAPIVAAYVDGMRLWFRAHVDCNAGATVTLNTISAIPLTIGLTPVLAGALKADQIYSIIYNDDSGVWQVYASSDGSFLGLSDTPTDYTGRANQAIIVNVAEDGLDFSGASVNVAAKMHGPTQQIGISGAEIVEFNTEDFDVGGSTVDLANNRFNINTDGTVRISFKCEGQIPSTEGDNVDWFQFYKNGIAIPGGQFFRMASYDKTASGTILVDVVDTDYLEVFYLNGQGTLANITTPFFDINSV